MPVSSHPTVVSINANSLILPWTGFTEGIQWLQMALLSSSLYPKDSGRLGPAFLKARLDMLLPMWATILLCPRRQ